MWTESNKHCPITLGSRDLVFPLKCTCMRRVVTHLDCGHKAAGDGMASVGGYVATDNQCPSIAVQQHSRIVSTLLKTLINIEPSASRLLFVISELWSVLTG